MWSYVTGKLKDGMFWLQLLAALISQKETFAEGIRFAQENIEGTASILILKEGGHLIAARDKMGRLPIVVGQREDGYCVTFEDFAGISFFAGGEA